MAKRFVDTRMGRDVWFRKLKPKFKCAFRFLCDECDAAGVWAIDMELMEYFIGEPIDLNELFEVINAGKKRIEIILSDKIFIIDFIDFQYVSLSETSPAHKPIFQLIKKHTLSDRVFNRVSNTLKETDKEMVKETDKDDESVREGNPVVVQMKPELFHNHPIVPQMVKDFRSYYPIDLKDEQDNVYARLIAVYITETLGFNNNDYEKEKKKEVLDYWNELLKFSVTDGFYRRFTLQMLSTKKNYNGLVKSYRDSLTKKINGNGTTGIATKTVGKAHDGNNRL